MPNGLTCREGVVLRSSQSMAAATAMATTVAPATVKVTAMEATVTAIDVNGGGLKMGSGWRQ